MAFSSSRTDSMPARERSPPILDVSCLENFRWSYRGARNASQLETLIAGMLAPATLLDLVRHFIVFEKDKKEDAKSKQVFIVTTKKMAAYHQYHAVNRAVASTLRASGYATKRSSVAAGMIVPESPESYGLPGVKTNRPAIARAAWSGTPRARANPFRWYSSRAR